MPLANFVEYRARLVELEPRIQVLERALAPLRLEESTIKERLNAYKYPVLTLPNEIVGQIFLHFLPKYPVCPPLAGPDSPVLLTHICRLWRAIALATPRLWRAISFSRLERISPNPRYIWLRTRRAGCCPLSFRILDRGNYYGRLANPLVAILSTRTRCEYLQLRLNSSVSALPTIEGEFPLLRYLDIELGCEAPREIQFLDAPMLRSVVLDGLAVEWVTRLPWTQLTTLSLHDIAFEDCVPVLPKATNLLDCRLDMSEDLISSKASPIVLPCLKSLKAEADDYIEGFLASFTLPALSSLTVCHELLGLDAVPSLKSFVARSGCNLQHLHMTCITATQFVEESYRVALPSIRKIDFSVDQDREPLNLLSNWHI